MIRRHRRICVALMAVLMAPITANAVPMVIGDFNILLDGSLGSSGGQITLSLNADGTIGASVTSTIGSISGIGIDSGDGLIDQSDWSPFDPSNEAGWGTTFGVLSTGFGCYGPCTVSSDWSWTIGTAGQFSSVTDILGGGESPFDFYMTTLGGGRFANASLVSVPEPATALLLGVGLVGVAFRRRKLN